MKIACLIGAACLLGSDAFSAIYTNQVKGEFRKKVEEASSRLKIDADHLVATMALETAKPTNPGMGTPTFDPAIENPSSGAVGLIQFMPKTAMDLGTTVDKLKKMTTVEQMVYVEKYLRDYSGKMKTLVDVYLAVFYPAAIGKPDDYNLPDWVYKQNDQFDSNGDKKISKGEIAVKIQRYHDRGKNK